MDALAHAVELAFNSLTWCEGELETAHPGVSGHLISARVQLDAVRRLLAVKEDE